MRILTLDIETAPATAYVWGLFKQNIGLNQLIAPGRMICWAAKWHGEKQVITGAEWDDNDVDFIVRLWDLLDEADAIVSYNGKTFDIPRIQAAFLEMGLDPTSPYHHIDLYQTVRTKFKFQSGKLDYVVRTLELGGKAATGGFETWVGCMEGDHKAQAKMLRYNAEDVRITERLYDYIRPWITNHPNVALYSGQDHACPRCGSERVVKRGIRTTNVSVFQQYRCSDCGSYSRSGKRLSGVDLRPV